MKAPKKPTEAELGILRVLWARGPSTVREVAETLGREGAYTTVLKLLQIMTEKGLVVRDERARTHVYEAAGSEAQTQKQLVTDLLDRVFVLLCEGRGNRLAQLQANLERIQPMLDP